MKNICIILNGPIINDSRVIKVINTLSSKHQIDLFYVNGKLAVDKQMFNENINLYSYRHPTNFLQVIFRHSVFYYEFNFLFKKILNTKKIYEVIYCNDLPTLRIGYKYKRKFGAKLIYDSHEIYLETINQFYIYGSNKFKNYLFRISIFTMKFFGSRFEKRKIKKVDEVITVNNSIADYFKKKYFLGYVHTIFNAPMLEDQINYEENLKQKLGYSKIDFIVIYQGVLNQGRGLLFLTEAFTYLPDNFKLLILGDGVLYNDILKIVSSYDIKSKVKMTGRVSVKELLKYTSIANLGANLLESKNLNTNLALPNKLFEYIHAGIPVLCSETTESINIINKYGIGFTTKLDPKKIAKTIKNFSEIDPSEYKAKCQIAKKELNWQKQEDLLHEIVTGNYSL